VKYNVGFLRRELHRDFESAVVLQLRDSLFAARNELARVAEKGETGRADLRNHEIRTVVIYSCSKRRTFLQNLTGSLEIVKDVGRCADAYRFRRKRNRSNRSLGSVIRQNVRRARTRAMIGVSGSYDRRHVTLRNGDKRSIGYSDGNVRFYDGSISAYGLAHARRIHRAEFIARSYGTGSQRGQQDVLDIRAEKSIRERP